MKEELIEIGKRIKELRLLNNVTSESLSRELGVDLTIYEKYENGEVDIPVGVLYKISRKFNIDLTAIITGEEPKLKEYCVVRKEKAPLIERRKEYKYQDLSYNFSHKRAETFLVTIEPKKDEKRTKYAHQGQEFNFVLSGRMKVVLNNHEIILEEGDSIYFNSSLSHSMTALDNKDVKFIAVIIS
ncbi:MAG TPA: cupin domain-containing protein [Spirochaetota bacterium]|nr:cupin domain-containing protein [Spirochaetota bacterium]